MSEADRGGPRRRIRTVKPVKRFLYLFQVEKDLPSELTDAVSADSDVFFLSYLSKSSDPRSVYYPSSSWTQGRNRLLREVIDTEYQYYIFGDADVLLELTRSGARSAPPRQSPWRAFEDFLLSYEPALGCPTYSWHFLGMHDETNEVQTIRFFDPLLNAFHREALLTLLPYYDLLDEESADYSGSIVCSIAADLYPGNVLQTNRVRVLNPCSARAYTERLLTKPETFYLESLKDPEAVETYRRQHEWSPIPHPTLGEPRLRPASYRFDERELSRVYDLGHPLWARKRELLDMPKEHEFFSASRDSRRARRWRERNPGRIVHVPSAMSTLTHYTRPLRLRLGLVRTSRPIAFLMRLSAVRHHLRVRAARWRRRLQRPSARALWRSWAKRECEYFDISEIGSDRILELIAYALDRVPEGHVLFVDVGTENGEMLGRLGDGTLMRKHMISIGVDPVQSRGFVSYPGYVLGVVDDGVFALRSILRQYGLGERIVHYLRITVDEGVDALRTLDDPENGCLFVTVRVPAGVRDVDAPETPWEDTSRALERFGFQLFGLSALDGRLGADATFVNERLLGRLVPPLLRKGARR